MSAAVKASKRIRKTYVATYMSSTSIHECIQHRSEGGTQKRSIGEVFIEQKGELLADVITYVSSKSFRFGISPTKIAKAVAVCIYDSGIISKLIGE